MTADRKIAPKIAIVMPRNMRFTPVRATSIDLCVHDYVVASRYKDNIVVYAQPIADPYADVATRFFSDFKDLATQLDRDRPDMILAQQHLPTAYALARRYGNIPVVMQAHNFQKQPKGFLKRWYKTRRYRALAGLVMVSNALVDWFRNIYPEVSIPLYCAHNGLDLSEWQPRASRAQEVLFVGRLTEEKGVFRAAEALAQLLPRYPDWRARFIVSTLDNHAGAGDRLASLLAPLGRQAIVEHDVTFIQVRTAMEEAAIALVPSVYEEAFGRTAIEAFAGGAALVASTRGGLREVLGSAAIPLEHITPDEIAAAVEGLIADPVRRAALAAAGRARVAACFTIQHNADAIDDAIDATLGLKSLS